MLAVLALTRRLVGRLDWIFRQSVCWMISRMFKVRLATAARFDRFTVPL